MNCQHSLNILEAAQFKGSLDHRHSRTSSVTTSWGVNWDEEFIARDLLQNFFDASRGFTDALTQLIETVVRQRQHLDQHESAWLAARKVVLQERNEQPAPDIVRTVSDLVAAMRDGELRDLLGRLPTDIVWQALEEQTA